MKNAPFFDEAQGTRSEPTFKDLTVIDSDGSLLAAVLRMKMRRRVVVVVHRDDDPEEPAQL